jgi:hypothetical protein
VGRQSPTQTDTLLGEKWSVDIVGRASSPGTVEHDERLGQTRAQNVEEQLKADLARPSARSRARSVGEQHASADPKVHTSWSYPAATVPAFVAVDERLDALEAEAGAEWSRL